MDRINDCITSAMKRIPVLANAEITSVVSGPIAYCPDAIPLLGPDAEVSNMWLALGSGYGVGLAGKLKTGEIITRFFHGHTTLFENVFRTK